MNATRHRAALCLAAAGLLIASTGRDAGAERPHDNAVLRWNAALLQAIRVTREPPMRAARDFAILHTCIYDAWAAYTARAIGTQLGDALRRPPHERHPKAIERAVSVAAHRALVDLFPQLQQPLFEPLLAAPADEQSGRRGGDLARAEEVGQLACDAVLAFRHQDGANQLGDLNGGAPYSDYTGYVPVNSAAVLADPDRWQPLAAADGSVQRFSAPHWGLVTPFALRSPDQFRPGPPATAGTAEYAQQAAEIVALSARLGDRGKAIALYWADGPSTETPPGHWNLLAQWVSHRDRHSLDDDVRLFFVLGNALLDASIAVWDTKRHYDSVRPISAVRYLYAGQTIHAWAGPGRGTEQIAGERFTPYLSTPPFAEYTSGHSAFSAAAARVLERFTGSRWFGASAKVLAGSSIVEPGIAPGRDVVLWWRTFDEAADQAGYSRRLGGIHFEAGDLDSRAMGRAIADLVWRTAQAYFHPPRRPPG